VKKYLAIYTFQVEVEAEDEADARERASFEAYNLFAGNVAEEPVPTIVEVAQ
jgi:hypothetical protein